MVKKGPVMAQRLIFFIRDHEISVWVPSNIKPFPENYPPGMKTYLILSNRVCRGPECRVGQVCSRMNKSQVWFPFLNVSTSLARKPLKTLMKTKILMRMVITSKTILFALPRKNRWKGKSLIPRNLLLRAKSPLKKLANNVMVKPGVAI